MSDRQVAHASLHYGSAHRPLAKIVPDKRWPGMWRISWPDGQLSDMTNLTRAMDAAEVLSEHGPPRRDRKLFQWRPIEPLADAAGSSLVSASAVQVG